MVPISGRLLVASPMLLDPNFARTVVLMLAHGDEGALGLVLNRPSDVDVGQVLPDAWRDISPEPHVLFVGGPVGSGKTALIFNPPSAYAVAKRDAPQVAADSWTFSAPAGPKGRFVPTATFFWGIWQFSKNQSAAKDMLLYLMDRKQVEERDNGVRQRRLPLPRLHVAQGDVREPGLHASALHHTSDYTPYEGFELSGAVRSVFLRGRAVIRDGAFVGTRGDGRFVARTVAG